MVAGWLNHKQLQIIKGIGKTATDTKSAELDPVVVNLLSGPIVLEDWSPQLPAVKNSGVWSDSPLTDGRQLLSAAVGNVIEKMSVNITDASYLGVMKQLHGLNQMAQDCRDFWQSQYQIEPVYLMWYAGCGAGAQYALLYNIEIAPEYMDSPSPAIRVSITLEREPYWRGLPPGANPKLWTFYARGQQLGTNKAISDLTLIANSDHLVSQTIQNRCEISPVTFTTYLSQNFIDVPATSVPGDAPALCCLTIENPYSVGHGSSPTNTYVGRFTKPTSYQARNGANPTRLPKLALAAGDATLSTIGGVGTKAIDATRGVLSNGSAVNQYVASYAFGAAAVGKAIALKWDLTPTGYLDINAMRGTYMVFVRCSNPSGVATDFTLSLNFNMEIQLPSPIPSTVSMPDVSSMSVNATYCGLSYVGQVTLPFNERNGISVAGIGTEVNQSNSLSVELYITKTSTSARTLIISEVLLIPIDEAALQLVSSVPATTNTGINIYDNTGYFGHGQPVNTGLRYINAATVPGHSAMDIEPRGDLTLSPGVNNRLYFLKDDGNIPGTSIVSDPMTVRVNIVPRWSGIRDV